jgi:uncharacterized phage protein (TIGR02218 family)
MKIREYTDHYRARLWRIKLHAVESRVILLTDWYEPLTIMTGETFLPQNAGMGTATRRQLAQPADMEVKGFIDSDLIKVEDVLRGLWDGAIIEEIVIDYRYPFHAPLHFARYFVSALSVDGGIIKADIKAFSKVLEKPVGENWGSSCRVPVFSQSSGVRAGCNLDPQVWGTYRVTGATTTDARLVIINFAGSGWVNGVAWGATNWGTYGKLEFQSGPNTGVTVLIKSWAVDYGANLATATIQKPLPYNYTTGDSVFLTPGCTHLLLGDGGCVKKFNNAINFQGEPHIPGRDTAFELV